MSADKQDGPPESGGEGGGRRGRVPEQGSADRGGAADDGSPAALSGPPPLPHRTPRADRTTRLPRPRPPARDHVPQQRRPPAESWPPPSDAELVARVRGGDDDAYGELYRRHADAVRRYARTCCRDAYTAEDLTGEVFARTLQAVRGGRGPESAVRAYLLTTVRRVAAAWGATARREHLVDDFAAFAVSAAGAAAAAETTTAGADVRAMHEADQSLAVRAFRSLPERWQAVLWHTAVEEESPSEVAPLLGLTANATAVLAHRAREGLRQAYLQAHVNTPAAQGECARHAERLGAHARGGLRTRADRELRRHLADCARCRAVVADLADVNARLKSLLPVATIGWFAASYVTKVAGIAAAGAAGAAGAAAGAAASAGTTSTTGAAGAGARSAVAQGLGLSAKAGIAAGVALAGTGVVLAAILSGSGHHPAAAVARPPSSAPVALPTATRPASASAGAPSPSSPSSPRSAVPPAPAAPPAPARTAPPSAPPSRPAGHHPPAASPSAPASRPTHPVPSPTASAPTPPTHVYRVSALPTGGGDATGPTMHFSLIDWYWRRHGLSLGDTSYGDGVSVHAPATLTVDLHRACFSYDATVGVDRLSIGSGRVRFLVYGDGTLLYGSGPIASGRTAAVHVGLGGHSRVRLVVRPAGGSVLSLVDWADARISCR